jgi:hypothetical protein
MSVQGWQVITWPQVQMRSKDLIRLIPRFKYLGTSSQLGQEPTDPCSGSTVWGCDVLGKRVGLTWEWVEVKHRVVALGDPMILLCNVELMSHDDEPAAPIERLHALHRVIYALPWQKQVVETRWHVGESLLAA